jgi:predicted branched-subunit amino acid permease
MTSDDAPDAPATRPTLRRDRRSAFWRGMRLMVTTPGLVLFLTAIGFGALARDNGMTVGHALFLSAAVYALPAQVVLVDQLARGATIATAALAVTLTAVRLLPMTVSLLPYLKDRHSGVITKILAVHFIAVTAWVEGNRRLPSEQQETRLPLFLGIGLGMAMMTASGSVVGFFAATGLPPVLAATLLFATPVYFLLALFLGMTSRTDVAAIALGALLGPIMYRLVPGLDLLLTGLIGGTLAVLIGRTERR